MLTNTITIELGNESLVLTKINQDNYGSEYYTKTPAGEAVTMTIAHTLPKQRGRGGESHLVKLSVEHFDAEGVYQRTSTAWTVIKTFDGVQSDDDSLDASKALVGFLMAPLDNDEPTFGNTEAVIGRQS